MAAGAVAAEDGEPVAAVLPDERISPILDLQFAVQGERHHRIVRELAPGPHPVRAGRQPLDGIGVRRRLRADAGVHGGRRTVVIDAATGEAMLLAAVSRRGDGNGPMLPMDEVVADGVAPVHMAPRGAVGVVLVEQVPFAAEEDRPVRVVHPPGRRKEMIRRPPRVLRRLRAGGGVSRVSPGNSLLMQLVR